MRGGQRGSDGPWRRLQSSLLATTRGRNALLNVFELWVGAAGVVSGVVFFAQSADTDGSAIETVVGVPLTIAWFVGYFLAGLLVWYGLLRPSPRWEVGALWLLGSATSINAVAILTVGGFRGVASGITLFALAVAAWVRADIVYQSVRRLTRERR